MGKRVFTLEARPKGLISDATPTQSHLKKHQVYENRLANHPIKKAEYFQRLMESTGASSIRQLADMTGEDWSYIARLLKVLKLPEEIRDYLAFQDDPQTVGYFNLRRLLEISAIGEKKAQLQLFRDMLHKGPF